MVRDLLPPFRTLKYLERKGNLPHVMYRGITTQGELFEAQYNDRRNYFNGVLNGNPAAFGYKSLLFPEYFQIEKRVLKSLSLDVSPHLMVACENCKGKGKFDDVYTCAHCNGIGKVIYCKHVLDFTIEAEYYDGEYVGIRKK